MKKLIIATIAILGLLGGFFIFSSQNQADTSDSLADGVLTVGMECDYAPYNWTTTEENKTDSAVPIADSDNAYCNGYDVVVAQYVADALNVELEVKKISWDGLIPALESGQIDAIIAGMSPTEERKQTISFTDSYYEEQIAQGVVVKADSPYASATSLADLDGASISAQLGTLQEQLVTQIPNVDQVPSMNDYASLQQAVISGQIDGYIAEEAIGMESVSNNADLVYVPLEGDNGFVLDESMTTSAIGVRKDDVALQTAINEVLATLSVDQREAWMAEASQQAGE